MPVDAVLFDLNGVVIDDEPVHLDAWRRTLAPLYITFSDEDYYGPLLGIPDHDFVQLVIGLNGRALGIHEVNQLLAAKSKLYNELVAEQDLANPGLIDFVRDLAAHVPLGVVSGALRPEVEYHLDRLGLRDCFKILVAAGEYPACKPNPAPYLVGLEALNKTIKPKIDPANVVVVEDSGHGVTSGLAAEMNVLGFTGRVAATRLHGAFKTIDDFRGYTYAALNDDLEGHLAKNS